MNVVFKIYTILHNIYGAQGWWPLVDVGYHKQDYEYPRTRDEIFEICLGVILTQNTTFTSVEKSLQNLSAINSLGYDAIKRMSLDELKKAIKPSGYFNQKAGYILNFIEFFETIDIPTRKQLLSVKGIGEESADSILLYGYHQAEFVVDAYTRRLLLNYNLIKADAKYKDVKSFLTKEINKEIKDKNELVKVYQEFHALIVAHAKRFYSKKPYGEGCPIASGLKNP